MLAGAAPYQTSIGRLSSLAPKAIGWEVAEAAGSNAERPKACQPSNIWSVYISGRLESWIERTRYSR